jgi:hypothetical protein
MLHNKDTAKRKENQHVVNGRLSSSLGDPNNRNKPMSRSNFFKKMTQSHDGSERQNRKKELYYKLDEAYEYV